MKKCLLLLSFTVFAINLSAQSINYTYDNLGRLTKAIYPDSTKLTYTYDASGNRVSTIVQNGCLFQPKPLLTINGNLAFCFEDSVVLSSSNTQNLWSTGETTQSIVIKQPGKYYVKAIYSSTCSRTSDTITVIVSGLPIASITPSGSTTFCSGDSVTLQANSGAGYTYLWSNGATTQNITVHSAGNYSVKVINILSCSETSAATEVIVNSLPVATITAEGSTTFSYGENVILTASPGSTYLWSDGSTTQSINVTTTGNYTVTVSNASGCSLTSIAVQVTVTKKEQTITFDPLPASKIYGGADFDLTAISSSGLPVSYASADTSIVTIVNGKIHIVRAGTTTITASQSGNTNYLSAPAVTRGITINKGSQTITFAVFPVKNYNDNDFDPGATINSGLTISYTSSNHSVAIIINGKIHIIGAGTTTITAAQSGNENYNAAANVSQTLTVRAYQSIVFAAISSKTYGDADFAPGAAASSGLAVSYISSNLSIATIVNGKIHIVGAGTTTITASQSGNTMYSAASDVSQVLAVGKASQTITFAALPVKNYNDVDFDPGATANSGLPVGYVSSDPSVATIANGKVHIVAEGTVTITASQTGNANYNAATNVGQIVKIIFTLPVTNFKISATGESCKTSNNGSINITAVQTLNYTAIISGSNLSAPVPYNFTGSLEIKDLSAGTYTVCITVAGQSVYKQCYDINITEPKDLTLYTILYKEENKISLNLEGGALYKIEFNGKLYQTSQSEITLPLLKGDNSLKVTTGNECQGVIEKTITVSEDIVVYPNPFENILNLDLGTIDSKKAQIEVLNISGKSVYSKQIIIEHGKISLDLSSLGKGLYLLKVSLDHSEFVHKILKR